MSNSSTLGLAARRSFLKRPPPGRPIRVTDVPTLVDGASIHPAKPLEGFTLSNVTGTCAKGIYLANIKSAEIANIKVTDFTGPLINISNVTGSGLKGATTIDPPKLPTPTAPYKLH